MSEDTTLINWLESHPEYTLRKHKGRWSCARIGTNYAYSTFRTLREAVRAAMEEVK